MRRRLMLLLFSCLLALYTAGQGEGTNIFTHRFYGVEDGMASKNVYCGTQDKQGFLWFGTRNGLNRFDGKSFLLFNKKRNKLKCNKIVQLACDDNNHLIVIYGHPDFDEAGAGIEVFDLNTYQIRPFKEVFPNVPFIEDSVKWLNFSDKEVLFYIGKERLCWRLSNGIFVQCPRYPSQETIDQQVGEFWDKLTEKYRDLFAKKHFSKETEWAFLSQNSNDCIVFDTLIGLNLYTNHEIKQLIDSSDWRPYANIEGIYSFFKDNLGNYWLGTTRGLIKATIETKLFTHYFTHTDTKTNYRSTQARGIYVDEKGLLYANIWYIICTSDGKRYPDVHWGGALCRYKNKMYGGNGNFYEFDNVTKKFTELPLPHHIQIWDIFFFEDARAILCSDQGIATYDLARYTFNDSIPRPKGVPKPKSTLSISRCRDGRIWAASENGLFVFDENGKNIIDYIGPYAQDTSRRFPLSNLYDFHEDAEGIFWLCTANEGLYRWDRKSNQLSQFTNSEGFPSNTLYRVEEDDFNNLWISTDNGLVRFNKVNKSTKTYTEKEGLSNIEFNRISSYKAPDGRMFFGGLDGVNAFYPKDILHDTSQYQVPLRVISFVQFDESKGKLDNKMADLLRDSTIIMRPGDRFFDMEFMLLNFEDAPSRYAYRIAGYDADWNYLNTNSIRISNLPYGDYTLHIKGQNPNGEWSKRELSFRVSVLKPFYLQWWFILLGLASFIATVFLFIRWRTQQLITSKRKLEVAVEQRTEELSEMLVQKNLMMKEIHHRVKNNLQVISGLLELQQLRTQDSQTQEALLDSQNRVLSIAFIHQNLYQHDDLKGVEIQTFTKELCNHIHRLFAKEACPVDIESNVENLFLDIDTALPLGLIINELLTNSYKYAFKDMAQGEIRISLKQLSEGHYHFNYFDNGKGLPPNLDLKKIKSLGLRLITRLSKQLGGEIQYTYQGGSNFELRFKDFRERSKMA